MFQTEEGWFCETEDDFFCPEGEYQTRVVITIIGDLRDNFKNKTEKEYKKFIEYIKEECDFQIRNESVNIIED